MNSSSLQRFAFGLLAGCAFLLPASMVRAQAAAPPAHTFTVAGNRFLMDGKPYQVLSGEMHYPRVPRAYWCDRFRKARAMGLNTITTYAFWNLHEPRPGVYDFEGQNDIAEYIREAQQEGLNVILRPGPFVCAEWELGGFPSWLLKDRALELRSSNPRNVAAMQSWFKRLGKEIEPLLLRNGGPIIAVQVENEYGSFGQDEAYKNAVKSALQQSGMNPDVLYTADGPDVLSKGSFPELPAAINYGSGDAELSLAKLDTLRPGEPRMTGEYWSGWFDHWGGRHYSSDVTREAAELEWMIRKGYSVSIYMFHGGTNFGWMNGANSDGTDYKPDTTSYDYDAALDEQGAPRKKFFAFRDAIARATGRTFPALPEANPAQAFAVAPRMETASLWRNLPVPVKSTTLLAMEDLDQSYGYILFRTGIHAGDGGELAIDGLHDYAQVYIDQKLVGTLDRREGTTHLTIPMQSAAATLDILVENSGRLNFTKALLKERKGITGSVTLGGKAPGSWEIFSLPMDNLNKLHFVDEACEGPCFYRQVMTVPIVADTYLDTRGARKGFAWLNEHPLGRIWSIGPQFALYAPGPWMNKGDNRVVFFDLEGSSGDALKSAPAQIYGDLTGQRE